MKAEKQHKIIQSGLIQPKRDGSKLGFVDNRPQTASQTKLIKAIQKNDSTNTNLIQRMAQVSVVFDSPTKKKIKAIGEVKDFKNGTTAGDEGWIGVEKYRSYYKITDGTYENTGTVGTFKNTYTNPEAGHILAKQNGGNGGDPENIFAQDGGTNNGKYKSFEIGMRNDLDKYEDTDHVVFTNYIAGDELEIGNIAEAGLSDASSISSEDSDSS